MIQSLRQVFLRTLLTSAVFVGTLCSFHARAHELQAPIKVTATKTKFAKKDGASFSLGSPSTVWASEKSELKFLQSDGKTKSLRFAKMDIYTPAATPEILKVLDKLISLNVVGEVALLEGSKGLNVFYSIDQIKLKNGVVLGEKEMMLLYNSLGEVSSDFIYRAIPNRAAIQAVLGAKPFGEGLSEGDLMAIWERAYGAASKTALQEENLPHHAGATKTSTSPSNPPSAVGPSSHDASSASPPQRR